MILLSYVKVLSGELYLLLSRQQPENTAAASTHIKQVGKAFTLILQTILNHSSQIIASLIISYFSEKNYIHFIQLNGPEFYVFMENY